MSYCNRASCLAHRRAMYWNMQDRAWVHTDGWPCDGGAAELAERAERQARADQAFYDEGPRDRHYCGTSALPHQPGPACSAFASPAPAAAPAADPAAAYAAVTLDAIAREGDLSYALYVAGRYLAEHPRPGRGSDQ
jgi:hypothetical protein